MTGIDEGWEIDDYDDPDPCDDDYDPYLDDPDHYREPDEPDYGYEEWLRGVYEHCDQVHDGRDCDCRPSLRDRLRGAWQRARRLLRRRRIRYADEPPF